jgi:hypothetical protein
MDVYREVHDLVFHGNGGFIYSEVYNMPIHIRRHNIRLINEYRKKQETNIKPTNNTNQYPKGPQL